MESNLRTNSVVQKWANDNVPQSNRAEFFNGGGSTEAYLQLLLHMISLSKKKQNLNIAYDSSAWAFEQADHLGYQRALFDLEQYINTILGTN